LIWILSTV